MPKKRRNELYRIKHLKGGKNLAKDAPSFAEKLPKKLAKKFNVVHSSPLKNISTLRKSIQSVFKKESKSKPISKNHSFFQTSIPGLDALFTHGIPEGSSVLIAGGTGSGKTILCSQILTQAAEHKKCLYLSFEETEERIKQHLDDFGWDWRTSEKAGTLKIVRKEAYLLTDNIEAMLAHARGELLIDINEVLEVFPKNFKPDIVVIDSLTAIAAAFPKETGNYRIFVEVLFRYLQQQGVTSFLISETDQVPQKYSPEGVEEFLADGVIVLYAIRRGNVRENAIEILKMRGKKKKKKIVAMQITNKGVVVYPEQEVFGEM